VGTTQHLRGVVAAGDQFVAVGNSGTILVSSNGVVWNPRPSGVTVDLVGVAWSGKTFVAVGVGGTIVSSP
jgi:hypothetical protein